MNQGEKTNLTKGGEDLGKRRNPIHSRRQFNRINRVPRRGKELLEGLIVISGGKPSIGRGIEGVTKILSSSPLQRGGKEVSKVISKRRLLHGGNRRVLTQGGVSLEEKVRRKGKFSR